MPVYDDYNGESGQYEEGNPGERSDENIKEIDYKIVSDISYECATAIQKRLPNLNYNEVYFALMFQLANFICDQCWTATGQMVTPQQVLSMLQQIVQTMYEMRAFDQIQTLVREKYDVERAVDKLLESVNLPPKKHDDSM